MLMVCGSISVAQDASTGALRGTLLDASGARIAQTAVTVVNAATGVTHIAITDSEGRFAALALPPGEYLAGASSPGLTPALRTGVRVEVGASVQVDLKLTVEGHTEIVTVSADAPSANPETSEVSSVIDEHAIRELPLNGRRFTDLALLTPGVTQDPRDLTSASNGDLSFGGIRGFQTSFVVDGADNNNAFFSQATGRYRAPYQFSNEVVQEFRVSSHSYGAEQGRSGGAVVNVVTKSGENIWHGSTFYYLRASQFGATPPGLDFKPGDRQHQFGGTIGGPIKRNRVFFLAGFDQHLFDVPTVVRFEDGSSVVTPLPSQPFTPGDYEESDKALVFYTASQLDLLAGTQRSHLNGNTGFFKLDYTLSAHHQLSLRVSTSRYYGLNNVFFDPASPITNYSLAANGEEDVRTESAVASLTSSMAHGLISKLTVKYSLDDQRSYSNTLQPSQRIDTVLAGLGRSTILPRQTHENKFQESETISLTHGRQQWKFGGDLLVNNLYNYFPSLSGGYYIFAGVRVNPFTFEPQPGGLKLTPLRAYAHQVPRYYDQNFGLDATRPSSIEYAGFVQDGIRLSQRLHVNLGLRYDRQTFASGHLVSNPLWPDSGKLPSRALNFAPRVGFAFALGDKNPVAFRGGYGVFFARIPQIYASQVELDNGLNQFHLQLDHSNFYQKQVFPEFPVPLSNCAIGTASCPIPAAVQPYLTTQISSFASNFRTPRVHQASLSAERDVGGHVVATVSYLYTRGENLIRARDVNLPKPTALTYPVFNGTGANLLGYYTVDSFANWQLTQTISCPFPPCINDLARPIPQIGAINVFETVAVSQYHGATIELKRRVHHGMYLRAAYTFAHAIDNVQDALVAGTPATVQNTFATQRERASSVTDQRQRLVLAWTAEPHLISHSTSALAYVANHWKLASIFTYGSGRPYDAKVSGDANQDGNSINDRIPGISRNSLTGPTYSTFDFRLSRHFQWKNDKWHLEALGEAFNLFNRNNRRFTITQNGLQSQTVNFVQLSTTAKGKAYPAQFQVASDYRHPDSSYAPRQMQLALKLIF